jgi:hypothetical protein
MRNQLKFSTFDPLFSDAPSLCGTCGMRPSVFHFESSCQEGDSECPNVGGFCCAVCATRLLEELERAESLTWAEEEAFLRKEGGDVDDFHTRRVVTFGTSNRN